MEERERTEELLRRARELEARAAEHADRTEPAPLRETPAEAALTARAAPN